MICCCISVGHKHGVWVWKMRHLKSMEGKMRSVENREFGKKQTWSKISLLSNYIYHTLPLWKQTNLLHNLNLVIAWAWKGWIDWVQIIQVDARIIWARNVHWFRFVTCDNNWILKWPPKLDRACTSFVSHTCT